MQRDMQNLYKFRYSFLPQYCFIIEFKYIFVNMCNAILFLYLNITILPNHFLFRLCSVRSPDECLQPFFVYCRSMA